MGIAEPPWLSSNKKPYDGPDTVPNTAPTTVNSITSTGSAADKFIVALQLNRE